MSTVYPLRDRMFRPWKNGGGETAEILVSPPGAGFEDFDWRISAAVVASDGPFSTFPGIDRVLTVIEGGPLRLSLAGVEHEVDAQSPPLAFPGDQPCSATLTGGPVLDFNVMVRRPLRAEVTRGPLPGIPPERPLAHLALLLAAGGGLSRLDLVDLSRAGPVLRRQLQGVPAILVTIRG